MTLTVEDGTGLENADAFVDVDYVDAYHAALGNTAWSSGTTDTKEQAIRRATLYLSESYNWKGYPVRFRQQALAWPRTYVEDRYGFGIDSDVVPTEVKKATAEVALRELTTPNAMMPDFTPSAQVKRERVGPLEVEYSLVRSDAEGVRPILLIVRDLIGSLTRNSGGRLSGYNARV